jgi:hypothetical protein
MEVETAKPVLLVMTHPDPCSPPSLDDQRCQESWLVLTRKRFTLEMKPNSREEF